MRSEDLETAAKWIEKRLDGESEEVWYYFGVTFLSRKAELDLLMELRPRIALRVLDKSRDYAEPGRYVAEGHGELKEIPDLLERIDGTATVGLEIRSVTVEPHDYELVEAPTLYFEA